MFIKIPMAAILMISDVPPYEIKGRVRPLVGITPKVTPVLMMT